MDTNKLSRTKLDEISRIDNSISELDIDPSNYIQTRLKKLDEDVDRMPVRKAKYPGNITMREHLINIRNDMQTEPTKYITRRREKLMKLKLEVETLDEVTTIGSGNIRRN